MIITGVDSLDRKQNSKCSSLPQVDASVTLYFITYIVLMVWVLINMVVAVILDEFMTSSRNADVQVMSPPPPLTPNPKLRPG